MATPCRSDGPRRGRPRRCRGTLGLLAVCAVAAAAGAAALDQFSLSRKQRQSIAWPADPTLLTPPDPARCGATPLTPGDPAASFSLQDVRTGGRVSLDQFRGRPVVLLLSSFGCNIFCRELGRLTNLYKAFQDDVPFVFIAIRDAGHPDPDTSPPISAPRPGESSVETRRRRVREAAEYLGLPFPVLFDADGEVERAFDAFPKRLVVVGADGRIVYDGGRGAKRGPSDWDLIEVEQHLRTAISESQGG
jgi:peroxiredoxin